MAYEYEYQKAIRELNDQGLTVEICTPQDGSWIVRSDKGESFILTQREMLELRSRRKLNLPGIKEYDEYLKARKAKK